MEWRGVLAIGAMIWWAMPVLAQDDDRVLPERPRSEVPAENYTLYPDPGRPRVVVPENMPVPGEQVVAGLSNNEVAITTSFNGSQILIYGAIKRETPIPPGDPLDVIVTVEAPSESVTIWRKARRLGIWINTERVDVGAAPGFYVVATTRPLEQILMPEVDSRYRISLPQALRSLAGENEVQDIVPFTSALIDLRTKSGLYRLDEGSVKLVDQTLFRADVQLPATLIEGNYRTRIFLVRNGDVIDVYRAPIEVRKVGLERWLYRMAFDQPFLYGLMSLAVAVAAGWGASVAFKRLRRV